MKSVDIVEANTSQAKAMSRIIRDISYGLYREAGKEAIDKWLDAAHSPEKIIARIESEDYTQLAVLYGGLVVGTAYATVSDADGLFFEGIDSYIGGLYLTNPFRRVGIGTELWRLRSQWLKAEGANVVGTEVSLNNVESLAFLESQGFERIQEVPGVMLPTITWVNLSKDLAA